jgi:magnesium transporter
VIVDRANYADGRRLDPSATPARDGFVWVGLFQPTPDELAGMAEEFDLHPLAVEDADHAHQRPKLEQYGGSWFLVVKTVEYLGREAGVALGEVMLFVGHDFVVSVRHGRAGNMREVRRELEADPARLADGPWEVIHTLVDRVVDEYQRVLSCIEEDIDDVQARVFDQPRAAHAARIFLLKREILEFRQAVVPFAEPLERLALDDRSPVGESLRHYFRDIHDHLRRVVDRLATIDDVLTSALHVNVAQVGMRQNEDMRKISAWVAIITLPMMIAGIYGMNFEHMPELGWQYGYPLVLASTALACYTLYRNFKRRDWL